MWGFRGRTVRFWVAAAAGLGTMLALASPAAAASTTGEAGVGVGAELQNALDGVVAAGASGAVLRVDDQGWRPIRLASGQARLDPPQAMLPGARIRVGSITKTFVSTVALQLVGEGRLRLDDSVERWLPGLIPGGDRITVRQLLNHTSGLFNYTEDQDWVVGLLTDPLKSYTPEQLVAVSNAHPPLFPPGTSWSYSNTNYIVAGLILQRVTRRSVADLVEQRIVRPLRLRHTTLPERSPDIAGYHAHGYFPPSFTGEGYLDFTRISPTWAGTAGALVSNVDDLRTFYQALLGGRLLRPAQLAQMKSLVPTDNGIAYGLGLFRWDTPCGPVWGHDGSIPGYLTFAFSDESGRHGFTFGLPTQADEPIAAAANGVLARAICDVLGQPVPSGSSRRVESVTPWAVRVDRGVTTTPRTAVAAR